MAVGGRATKGMLSADQVRSGALSIGGIHGRELCAWPSGLWPKRGRITRAAGLGKRRTSIPRNHHSKPWGVFTDEPCPWGISDHETIQTDMWRRVRCLALRGACAVWICATGNEEPGHATYWLREVSSLEGRPVQALRCLGGREACWNQMGRLCVAGCRQPPSEAMSNGRKDQKKGIYGDATGCGLPAPARGLRTPPVHPMVRASGGVTRAERRGQMFLAMGFSTTIMRVEIEMVSGPFSAEKRPIFRKNRRTRAE